MLRAIACGINNLEELKHIKRKEAEQEATQQQGAGSLSIPVTLSSEVPEINLDQSSMPMDNPSFSEFLCLAQGSFSSNSLEGAGHSLGAQLVPIYYLCLYILSI